MRRDARDRRLDRREAPRVVRLQHPVDCRGQAGGNAYRVGRAGLQVRRDEAVQRRVQPLPRACQGRVELQHGRRRSLLEDREGRHRAVELHEDLGVRGHVRVPVAGDDGGDLQLPLDPERMDVVAHEPHGAGIDDGLVLLPALPARVVGLEQERSAVEPGERPFDRRCERDEVGPVGRGGGIGEGERQRGQPWDLLPARRNRDRGRLRGRRHGHRDVAVAVVPAAAEAVVEGQPDRPQNVPVPAFRSRADVDPQGVADLLPHPHLHALDRDVAEAEMAGAAQPVVEEQRDRPQRVPQGSLGTGADVDAQRIVHVLPDAHVDIGGVPRVGACHAGACDEGQRHHEGAQESVRQRRARVHGAGFLPGGGDTLAPSPTICPIRRTENRPGKALGVTYQYASPDAIVPSG